MKQLVQISQISSKYKYYVNISNSTKISKFSFEIQQINLQV